MLKVLDDFSNFLKQIGYDIKADNFKAQDNNKKKNHHKEEKVLYLYYLE